MLALEALSYELYVFMAALIDDNFIDFRFNWQQKKIISGVIGRGVVTLLRQRIQLGE